MAYLEKTGKGWRAHIAVKGVRQSRTFTSKAAAQMWATREEAAIIDGTASRWPRKTLGDAIDRYERDITPSKGAKRFEGFAFTVMRREHPTLLSKIISAITPADLAQWRDERLEHVSGSTVVRYAALLRSVWTVAAREWGWTPDPTPWKSIKLPIESPPRERLIGWREARAVLRRLNFTTGIPPATKMQATAWAFLVALRTGLRAGEVLGLTGESVNLSAGVVTLTHHKTKHITRSVRQVPLTKQAVRLLRVIHKPGPLLDVAPRSLDALFRKARGQCLLSGFTFHDSRATAITHLSRRVDVLTLARISGHRDVSMLLRYYRESAADISARL